eukprot:scaffold2610_cov115-Isochrysis_galbana.AAC.4
MRRRRPASESESDGDGRAACMMCSMQMQMQAWVATESHRERRRGSVAVVPQVCGGVVVPAGRPGTGTPDSTRLLLVLVLFLLLRLLARDRARRGARLGLEEEADDIEWGRWRLTAWWAAGGGGGWWFWWDWPGVCAGVVCWFGRGDGVVDDVTGGGGVRGGGVRGGGGDERGGGSGSAGVGVRCAPRASAQPRRQMGAERLTHHARCSSLHPLYKNEKRKIVHGYDHATHDSRDGQLLSRRCSACATSALHGAASARRV